MNNSPLDLPAAPDGHFWRIGSVLGFAQVQLRKRVWFFSVNVDTIIPVGTGSEQENVEWAAQEILERIAQQSDHDAFMRLHQGDQ